MNAKIILQTSDAYGKIVDVVWNPYMNKYTDGKKLYAKEELSFEGVETERDESKWAEKIKAYAFSIFCFKLSGKNKVISPDEAETLIENSVVLAKEFDTKADALICPVPEKDEAYYTSLADSVPVEEEANEPIDIEELIEPINLESDKGLSDYLKELNDLGL